MEELRATAICFACHRTDISRRKKLFHERWGLERNRLRRPSSLVRHVAFPDRPLFDGKQRFSGKAIENKYEAHLGYLSYRGRQGAVVSNVNQHWLRWQIVVPEIVMNHLVVPDQPSAGGIERHHTI